jgi:2-polyprenyl-3-methyl-5-hydroxy-6-metoxy-1,4-benzoquinol methylase
MTDTNMSKEDWQKNHIPTLFPDLPKVESILDVGCGLSLKSKYIPANIRVGVDIYPEYFNHIDAHVPYVAIKYDARHLGEIFQPKSFDLVIAMDIIEHLYKGDALSMIKQCESIARVAVILETPEGFIPQDMDITGHGGNEYQTHRCGWAKKELEDLGYTVKVRDYLMDDTKRHSSLSVSREIRLMDAIKYI